MIPGTVSLVAVKIFLLEHKQIKTSSLPSSREQTFSQGTNSEKYKESWLSLRPPFDLVLLYNQFNNSSQEKNNDPENVVNSKFYDIDENQTLKFPDKHKSLSLFPINACSLNKNFNDFDHLLKCTNKVLDIIAVNETRITKKTSYN